MNFKQLVLLTLLGFGHAVPVKRQNVICGLLRFLDRNLDLLEQSTLASSGISGNSSGVYLTVSQVISMTAQPNTILSQFDSFFESLGLVEKYYSPFNDWVYVCTQNGDPTQVPSNLVPYLAFNGAYISNATSYSTHHQIRKARSKKHVPTLQNDDTSQPQALGYFYPAGPNNYPQLCGGNVNFNYVAPLVTFPLGSNLMSPGMWTLQQVMENTNLQGNWIGIVPCNVQNGIVSYQGCNFNVINSFQTIFANSTVPYPLNPLQSITTSSTNLKQVPCSQISTNSGLSNACSNIKSQIESEFNIVTDISSTTPVWIIDVSTISGFPQGVMVTNWNLEFSWSSGVLSGTTYNDVCGNVNRVSSQGIWSTSNPQFLSQQYSLLQSIQATGSPTPVNSMVSIPGLYQYVPNDLTLALEGTNSPSVTVTVPPTDGNPFWGPLDTPACWQGFSTNLAFTVDTNCGEPSLDVQMLSEYGNSPFSNLLFLPSNDSPSSQLFENSLFGIFAQGSINPLPDIMSMSYGFPFNGTMPDQSLINAIEATYLKLAAIGTTLLASSGDQGASSTDGQCANGMVLSYPAVSPWVTAVGATQWASVNGQNQEIACVAPLGGQITSGGGFSPFTSRPSWQDDVVSSYLAENSGSFGFPTSSTLMYSSTGRAYPDVALSGYFTPTVNGGFAMSTAGTSVSSPTLAGLLTQILVQLRQNSGWENEKLGFINPFLYWAAKNYPSAFNDITIGNNIYSGQEGPSTDDLLCQAGYPAAVGWDAVTGLGSINQSELYNAAKAYISLQRQARGLTN